MFEPLQEHFEPLWIGSFATASADSDAASRQARSGLRALMEKGLAVTLADYARAFEARSGLGARSRTLASQVRPAARPVAPTAAPPVETLYNSDAFPRWTKGAPYTLPAI